MSITVTDIFCGGGGSSTGMINVPDVEIVMAANHWDLAIEVHNANHPNTDHAAVDLHEEDPRYFPTTDILWASPECTKWSQASGGKYASISTSLDGDLLDLLNPDLVEEDEETRIIQRSRLLMFDVLRFVEHHRYRALVVENVVDIATNKRFAPEWTLWRKGLANLGYDFRIVSLNSMHASTHGGPAPQSRDRLYIVAWRKGDRAPDIDRVLRPLAHCPKCDEIVEAQQAWKNGRKVGKYRAQYVYIHGDCGAVVEPGYLPAAAAIDWTLRGTRIGDRAKPLAEKTRRRIAAGIARYWRQPLTQETKAFVVPLEGRAGDRTRSVDQPLRTQTSRHLDALAQPPFIAELHGGGSDPRPTTNPLSTVSASGNQHALVMPYYGASETALPVSKPVGTLTTIDRYALVMRNNTPRGNPVHMVTPIYETLRTLTTAGHQSLLAPGDLEPAEAQVDDCLFRMLEPHEVAAGMAFPADYQWFGTRRERVRLAGNAVTPPAARDLIAAVAETLRSAA